MNKFQSIFIFLTLLLVPSLASGTIITTDTTWSGEVTVNENVLIPEGVTLTISPGTVVRVSPLESTKTDPEFISFLTEILVRGTLIADGKEGAPVTFLSTTAERSAWAGIIIDSGKAVLRSCIIRDGEAGVEVIKGTAHLKGTLLTHNRYGLTVEGPEPAVHVETSRITENDYGLLLLNGAKIDDREMKVSKNRKKDVHSLEAKDYHPALREYTAQKKGESRTYGDEAFLGTVLWQGRITVAGIVRVPLNSRLVILPGTVVEFTKKDTNNDGIGENGLFIQGGIIAKGTKDNPIFFRSAEENKRNADWDSINILNSDRAQNLIEHCQIENAYRGLHFHFANVAVRDSVIKNNARGIQFQESIVEIRGTHFYGNNSALWARDSEITFHDNLIYHNYSGINFFRNTLSFRENAIMHNLLGGLRVREGISLAEGNLIDGNRYGMLVVDAVYGSFNGNVISHNLESGIALKNTDNLDISGNAVQANGLYGISIQDSSALIRGNLIAENGERGIGIVTFHGEIRDNNILGNGLYNLGIDGDSDVNASSNWWGKDDVKLTIFDRDDDPSKGRAEYLPVREGPVALTWPLKTLQADALWQERVIINEYVTVLPGIHLTVLPNSRIMFAGGAGIIVKGKITARGNGNGRITFSSLDGDGSGEWDEINLEHADGSVFSDCIIKNATWALHVHFSELTIERCSIIKNYGGLRFRSGPVKIRNSSFRENEIGIRAFVGSALITQNVIAENRIGIFVREKGGGLTIRKNNLYGNSDYNIRVGDFNDEDIDAKDNWWGPGNPADTIFDSRREPGIGKVHFQPYLTEAVREKRKEE